jgi:hypothetical protein
VTKNRALPPFLLCILLAAGQACGQSGLRMPQHGEPGLDPSFALGWFTPEYDRFGFSQSQRNWSYSWSYSLSERSSLSMGMVNSRDVIEEQQRQLSLYGRYSLTQDWALSAETLSRDATGLFRLQDFRIGVQRRF